MTDTTDDAQKENKRRLSGVGEGGEASNASCSSNASANFKEVS